MNEDGVMVSGEAMGGAAGEAGSGKADVIGEIFGSGRISYDEFLIKAAEAGVKVGDVGEAEGRFEKKIHEVRCLAALERELDRSGAKNREIIAKVIDMGKVSSDDGGVYGLSEQFAELKKAAPYLFRGGEDEGDVIFSSGLSHGGGGMDVEAMDDGEYYRKVKKM